MLHEERQRAGAVDVGGKHLLRSARELIGRLGQLNCMASDDMVNVNPAGTGEDQDSSDDNDAGSDSAESVESEPEGTFNEMEADW